MPRDIVLLQRLADNLLRRTVGVHVGRVPRVDAHVIRRLEQRHALPPRVSRLDSSSLYKETTWQYLVGLSFGAVKQKHTSSPSTAHGMLRLSPRLMAPKMGTETRSPLWPSWRYSTFVASREALR